MGFVPKNRAGRRTPGTEFALLRTQPEYRPSVVREAETTRSSRSTYATVLRQRNGRGRRARTRVRQTRLLSPRSRREPARQTDLEMNNLVIQGTSGNPVGTVAMPGEVHCAVRGELRQAGVTEAVVDSFEDVLRPHSPDPVGAITAPGPTTSPTPGSARPAVSEAAGRSKIVPSRRMLCNSVGLILACLLAGFTDRRLFARVVNRFRISDE